MSNELENAKTPLIVMCDKGHIYTTNWNRLQQGKRCPHCYRETHNSKGVREITRYLNNNNIKFEREYKFDDCRFTYPLPFDFAVFKDGKIILIEFDGKQHFEPIKFIIRLNEHVS